MTRIVKTQNPGKTFPFLILLGLIYASAVGGTFTHPGLLHSRANLERMKVMVSENVEPFKSGFEVFKADPASMPDYRVRGGGEEIGRNPSVNFGEFDADANASYQLALMWAITGQKACADKAIEIINAWSGSLKRVSGRDAVLMGGLGPFKMVNAAEILRYTNTGWSEADIRQCEQMFLTVIYPAIRDFAPFANGNWDIAAIQTVMAIGVFCSDEAIFERGLRYYVNGSGNGRLTHYIIDQSGQCQESGRDQQHTQLGLALLAACCETAWQQGLDLYAYADYRLLKGFEYTAKYNLGQEVPFTGILDRTGKYRHEEISTKGRGQLRSVYEMVYNHYVNRVNMAAPYTQKAAEQIRPEGPGRPGADHPGFGTLLFSRTQTQQRQNDIPPAAPAGIVAGGTSQQIEIKWIASIGAAHYTVKRAEISDGPYTIIARDERLPHYTDTQVQAGKVYYYTVSAANPAGSSPDAYPAGVCAGLPNGWKQADSGRAQAAGSTDFDGQMFTVEGAGTDIGSTSDQLRIAYVQMTGDCVITARYVPQVSSQFSRFGLMMRQSLDADAAHASLLITPRFEQNVESPGWYARFMTRTAAGADTAAQDGTRLEAPCVSYGRLTGCCWLRLERSGDRFAASVSPDGQTWTEVGQRSIKLDDDLYAGLAVCSGLKTATTSVKFDHVDVSAKTARHQLTSPDGLVKVTFMLTDKNRPSYTIDYMDKPIVLESQMGLEPNFTDGFELLNTSMETHEGQWTNDFGERKIVPDNYRQMTVRLTSRGGRRLDLIFRTYNEGAALRYCFPKQDGPAFALSGECTEFCFPPETYGYEAHGTEGEYNRVPTADIQPWCERPLTLEYHNGLYASLNEAANLGYPRMLLSPLAGTAGALVSALGGTTSNTNRAIERHDPTATLPPGEATPWRVFIVGRKPGDLLERNYLLLNLNAPSVLKDTSWIKPGKVMRDTTLTTANSREIIDFASKGGLQYVHLDSKWYGTEEAQTGDATTARAPKLDIQEVLRYGRQKDVGLIVYVDRRQLKKQRDILFPLYEQWGIQGVKIGFIEVGPQAESVWTTETIAKAAQHRLMLNIHDGYRATGINRTYPNLMTVEGIRGNEHMPTPEHNCTLPFTRYVGGIGDYTVCYYDKRLKTTHAHQLAMAVVSFSPLQWIYWYDKPSMYSGEPEVEFFSQVPTVWDETKVIAGEIGKVATIARRSGDNWFVGTINSSEPRQLKVPLDFLDPGKTYLASMYYDDQTVQTKTKVGIDRRQADYSTVLDVPLAAGGGQAVWIKALP